MKKKTHASSPKILAAPRLVPTHEEIAVEAEVLWRQRGCPRDHDLEIWLEAERQLLHIPRLVWDKWDKFARSNPLSRMDLNSDDVMAELEELFPPGVNQASTAL